MEKTTNITAFAATTLAPAGIEKQNETNRPAKKQTTETIAEVTTTFLNDLHTRIAVNAGNITRLDMSIAPIILMPITIVTAVSNETRVL